MFVPPTVESASPGCRLTAGCAGSTVRNTRHVVYGDAGQIVTTADAGVGNAGFVTSTTPRDLLQIAEPVVTSGAFRRLYSVTFLGILSSRFSRAQAGFATDGTRAEHSLGVARIALDAVRHLGLSGEAERYAAAWGLLHDVATWPLSHTAEPAFARVTEVESRTLRRMLLLGDRRLPGALWVRKPLRAMGVLPERLLLLFERTEPVDDKDMHWLWQIIRSRITPDTLEGIYRAGRSFGLPVPPPESVWRALDRTLFDVTVQRRHLPDVAAFWEAKGRVYAGHINTPAAIVLESRWARAIEVAFRATKLGSSLLLTEEEVVRRVRQFELPHVAYAFRYKPPLDYTVADSERLANGDDVPLGHLDRVLVKQEIVSKGESAKHERQRKRAAQANR